MLKLIIFLTLVFYIEIFFCIQLGYFLCCSFIQSIIFFGKMKKNKINPNYGNRKPYVKLFVRILYITVSIDKKFSTNGIIEHGNSPVYLFAVIWFDFYIWSELLCFCWYYGHVIALMKSVHAAHVKVVRNNTDDKIVHRNRKNLLRILRWSCISYHFRHKFLTPSYQSTENWIYVMACSKIFPCKKFPAIRQFTILRYYIHYIKMKYSSSR